MTNVLPGKGKRRAALRAVAGALSVAPMLSLASCSSSSGNATSCATSPHADGGTTDSGKTVSRMDSGTPHMDAGHPGKPSGNPDHDAGTAPDGGEDGGASPTYHVSNVPGGSPALPHGAGDNVLNDECELDTSAGTIGCPGTNEQFDFSFSMIDQPGGGRAALFVMKSLRVAQAAQLHVHGGSPAIIYALDDIVIDGTVSGVTSFQPAGGFPQDSTGHGGGLGGGESLLNYDAAGGGSYCGVGGKGGPGSGGTPRAGGKVYGNPEIVPLIGGSSGGGGGNVDMSGGNGGAGLQLSAGRSITVSLAGVINVGGIGGHANGGAGGSGGSLILEAPAVSVRGTLAANGGGGAIYNGGASGQSGQPNATAALGSVPTAGVGSAGKTKDGGNGSPPATGNPPNDAGGGGGGAGRIRINTMTGSADLMGATLSPDPSTGCATQGKLGA